MTRRLACPQHHFSRLVSRWHQSLTSFHKRKSSAGFTLIELLIVTAVFSLIALVSTTVITRIQSTQRQILGKQRVVADGRYVLETVARAVRQNFINYQYYGDNGPALQQTVLATKDQTSVETCYRWDSNNKQIQVLSGAGVTNCAAGTWVNITPADLVVDDFHVFIAPLSDPFRPVPRTAADCRTPGTQFDATRGVCSCTAATATTACFPDQACQSTDNVGKNCVAGDPALSCLCQNANHQPEVTIVIKTRTKNQASGEGAKATLQTTVTSHLYRR